MLWGVPRNRRWSGPFGNYLIAGLIPSTSFREQIRLDEGGRGVDFKATFSADQLKVHARNMILMTLGNTGIAMNKALFAWGPVPSRRAHLWVRLDSTR